MIDGLVVLDKPAGWTSHDVVARCRKVFGQKRVGHAGTLDPDATGVLLVGLGQVTRLLQFLSGLPKSYVGQVVLGVATSTLDASGQETGRWDMSGVDLAAARAAAATLTGTFDQIPPMVSARKVGGRRLHELARAGLEVERPARTVTVSRFELDGPEPSAAGASAPVFSASVDCSSGTYVRSLAAELGERLGGGAHLRALRRVRIGTFRLDLAVPLDRVGPHDVLPPRTAVAHLAQVSVSDDLAGWVRHGRVLERTQLDRGSGTGPWAVIDEDGRLLGVYQAHGEGSAKPVVVLAPS